MGALAKAELFAEHYRRQAVSLNTMKTYGSAWRDFCEFCKIKGYRPLPASIDTVAAYVAFLGSVGARASTITVRLAAVRKAHLLSDKPDPTQVESVRNVLKGIRRDRPERPVRKKAAVMADIKKMVDATRFEPSFVRRLRDKAILLVGMVGALRKSELVALKTEDIDWHGDHAVIHIRQSKGDQNAEGQQVMIPMIEGKYCPVEALIEWMDCYGQDPGPVFRSVRNDKPGDALDPTGKTVTAIIKKYAGLAGLPNPEMYSGHSLRRGFVTQARRNGRRPDEIMKQTRHKRIDTVLVYDEEDGATALSVARSTFQKDK